jgi:sulfofructosephosphate aldolase
MRRRQGKRADDLTSKELETNYVNQKSPALSRLADDSGTYSMLAIDQRESLRTMLSPSVAGPATDTQLSQFKVEAVRALSPMASAVLVDVDYGLGPILEADVLAKTCPMIVAVDKIIYADTGLALSTSLRPELFENNWGDQVAGAKFLLIWTPSGWLGCTSTDIRSFVELSAAAGLDSVLEVVVREEDGQVPSDARQAELLVTAAREMAPYNATIYKTEVPFRMHGDPAAVTAVSAQITDAINSPWVILSSGVQAKDFPDAVRAARAGGASGFLAGRAIWANATGAAGDKIREQLETVSRGAFDELLAAVHANRPASEEV